jgi:dienelactone hydrolase
MARMRALKAFTAGFALASCAPAHDPTPPVPFAESFLVHGDPESAAGATWTFRGVVEGTRYDLSGVLLKPPGPGPFPAVILSHGFDGNAAMIASLIGRTMVRWGLVCIAPNYTHSTDVPIGEPGNAREPGASRANVLRAHMAYELLSRLSYVDTTRVALHGHSMGAYLDVAVAGAYPRDFRVASQTGGGVRPDYVVAGPAPSPNQARGILTPFQMHHGDRDTTVPLSFDQRFDALLTAAHVEHQLFIYENEGHLEVRTDPQMLSRVHAWYAAHGMF